MANFNVLASFYDPLKKIVFQATLDEASRYFIPYLPDNSKILILGGGTGELLEYFNSSQAIVYLEESSKMIEKAKERNFVATVDFECSAVNSFKFTKQFDCIITPFVLDCLPNSILQKTFDRLNKQLKVGGLWLQTDFYPQTKAQYALVKLMYFFFRKTTGLDVYEISNFNLLFLNKNFVEKKNVRFKHGLIQSKFYRKIE